MRHLRRLICFFLRFQYVRRSRGCMRSFPPNMRLRCSIDRWLIDLCFWCMFFLVGRRYSLLQCIYWCSSDWQLFCMLFSLRLFQIAALRRFHLFLHICFLRLTAVRYIPSFLLPSLHMSMFGGDMSYFSGSWIFVYFVIAFSAPPCLLLDVVPYFIVIDIFVVSGVPNPRYVLLPIIPSFLACLYGFGPYRQWRILRFSSSFSFLEVSPRPIMMLLRCFSPYPVFYTAAGGGFPLYC